MLGTSWECHKVREFALRPMGGFLPVLDHKYTGNTKGQHIMKMDRESLSDFWSSRHV